MIIEIKLNCSLHLADFRSQKCPESIYFCNSVCRKSFNSQHP